MKIDEIDEKFEKKIFQKKITKKGTIENIAINKPKKG